MALPDDLLGSDIKVALCERSVGFKVISSKPDHWYLERGSVQVFVPKHSQKLRPSFVAMILFDSGVGEKQFLEALAAVKAGSEATHPPVSGSSDAPPTSA